MSTAPVKVSDTKFMRNQEKLKNCQVLGLLAFYGDVKPSLV